MICTYCRSHNGPEDHRCQRCGRRLNDETHLRRGAFPVQVAATAPKLQDNYDPSQETVDAPVRPQLVAVPARPAPSAGQKETMQPSLFGPQLVTADAPRTMNPRAGTSEPMSPAPSDRRKTARANHPQAMLFDATHDGSRALPTSVEARLYRDLVVASAGDRSWAAVIDTLIPLFGCVLFAAGVYWRAGMVELNPKTLPWMAAALAMIFVIYRLVWVVGGVDSPGLQAANLRLLTFNGYEPGRLARLGRLLGGIVSAGALTIGLLWSLMDEERLAWHDHMTNTFPARRS